MAQTGTKQQPETIREPDPAELTLPEASGPSTRENFILRLQQLWGARRALTRAAVAGVLLGSLIAFLLPARYESTAKLMPPDESSSSVAMLASLSARSNGGLGLIAGDLLGLKSSGELFVGILESETIRARLVDQFNLGQVYGLRHHEDCRTRLGDSTRVLEDRRSGIITLSVSDHSPTRAAALANAYVANLNQLIAELSTSAARRERIFLEDRLKSVKVQLEESEKEFSEFASKNHAIDITEQGKAMVGAAATLQGQLIAAQAELEGLRQVYTENNARVRAARARVDEIRHELEKMGGKGEDAENASKDGDSLYPSLRRLPILGVNYADLYRQMKIQEAVYESLTQQNELAKVEEAKETPSVRVLDQAETPERKSFPPRLMIVLVTMLASVICTAVWVQASAHWTSMDSQDPGKLLARDVSSTIKARIFGVSENGSGLRAFARKTWGRFGGNVRSSDDLK